MSIEKRLKRLESETKLWRIAGGLRLALDLTDDLPGLHLYDSRGNIRGMFTVFDDGEAGLAFFDSDGEVVWAAP